MKLGDDGKPLAGYEPMPKPAKTAKVPEPEPTLAEEVNAKK